MPLAAIPAIVGASIIGGGSAIAGGLLSKQHQTAAQQQQVNEQNALLQQQQQASQYALGQAQSLLPQSSGLFQKAIDYYSPLVSGNRDALAQAFAPQRAQMAQDYTNNLKALQFAPRGGGRGGAMQDLGAQQNSQFYNNLFQQIPNAANQLSSIGGQLGSEATNLFGQATGTAGNTINSLTGLQNLQLAQNQQSFNNSSAVGGAIFQLLNGLLNKNGSNNNGLPPPVLVPPGGFGNGLG